MSERMTEAAIQKAMADVQSTTDKSDLATQAFVDLEAEMDRARTEEARLLEVVKKQEGRIVVLEAAVRAVMGSLTTFGDGDALVSMRRDRYEVVLAAKVSP